MILNRIKIYVILLVTAAGLSCGGTDMWDKSRDVGVPCYSITYNANGATAGTIPVDASYYKTGESADVLLPGNLALAHYHFTGWNTASDGSGDDHAAGDTIVMGAENIILYAVWVIDQHTVTYNANGATDGTVPASVTQNYGTTVTAAANNGNLVLIPADGTAEAKKFGGWNTRSNGSGTTYDAGNTGTLTQDVTLYVLWIPFVPGDTGPAGGLIFYDKGSFSSGWRYLEAAPSDQSTGIIWNNGSDSDTGATGTAVGTGSTNTAAIIQQQGSSTSYAAYICSGTISGYSDWFLPSKEELNSMYSSLNSLSGAGFASAVYWSSTEVGTSNAWAYDFSTGSEIASKPKGDQANVRAIRGF